MTWSGFHIRARVKRLSGAAILAVSLHVLLLASGWLVIKHTQVPSDQSRPMVLTLQSTPIDGLNPAKDKTSDTLNNTRLGEKKDMLANNQPAELSPLSTLPHPKPTFEIEPEPTPEMDSESVQELINAPDPVAQVIEQITPSKPLLEEVHKTDNQDPPATQQVVSQEGHTEQPQKQQLITQDNAALTIASTTKSTADPRPISPKKQQMLERKLQRWAQQMAGSDKVNQSYSWQHKGQSYIAEFTHLPANGDMDLDQMQVEVRTQHDGQNLTTTMRLKKLAFSNFAQFVHRWDPNVLMHDDEMDGRFHSNSEIMLGADRDATPVFYGKVTTASRRVKFQDSVRRARKLGIFQGGLETGVKKIYMPKPRKLFQDNSHSNAIYFDQDTRIVFTPEGGFLWQTLDQTQGVMNYQELADQPTYLIAKTNASLTISGQVRGKVMVYSPDKIVIENDLSYAQQNLSKSDDVIGVISDGNIEIAEPSITGSGDLLIQASLYAKRSFKVREYRNQNHGVLNILGSVSAGSVGATQPRYSTRIQFDQRFEDLKPPGFPVTNNYDVVATDGVWIAD